MHISVILNELSRIAPLDFAESWDNVGLLAGSRSKEVERVMTCLTLTQSTLEEAIDQRAELVVCHHPIPFKPLSKLTDDTITGKILLRAIEAGVAIYSPHTAWDNAQHGINQQFARMLHLQSVQPLQAFEGSRSEDATLGVGRYGTFSKPITISEILQQLQTHIQSLSVRHTHEPQHTVRKIGIVCGSGGSMLPLVARRGCDAMLTGEATYHQCLEAEASGVALLMIGHHASEFFAMKELARLLSEALPKLSVFCSQREHSQF